jgi:CRP-like cAMP-binding protein
MKSSALDQLKVTAESCGVTDHTTQALKSIGILRKWTDGAVIISRGQVNTTAFLLVSGKLRVSISTLDGDEKLLRWLVPGEITGLSSAISDCPYPGELISKGECQVLHLERESLIRLIRQDADVALDLLKVLGLRINQMFDTMTDQIMTNPEHRVWAALKRLVQFNGLAVAEGTRLNVTQDDIAHASGVSRQHVNIQLKRFQDNGLIRIGYRYVVLLHPLPRVMPQLQPRAVRA